MYHRIYVYEHPGTQQVVEVHRPAKESHAVKRARKNYMDVLKYDGYKLIEQITEWDTDEWINKKQI